MSLIEFNRNVKSITDELTNSDSFVVKQKDYLRDLLKEFAIDNEQLGMILADANKSILEEINKIATSMAIELIRVKNESAKANADVATSNAQRMLFEEQKRKTVREKQLVEQEILTEIEQTELVGAQAEIAIAQKLLVERQTASYDDKRMMSKAEYSTGMAKMALNAGADEVAAVVADANVHIGAI